MKKDLAHKWQARTLDARSRIIIHVRKCYSLAFSLRVYCTVWLPWNEHKEERRQVHISNARNLFCVTDLDIVFGWWFNTQSRLTVRTQCVEPSTETGCRANTAQRPVCWIMYAAFIYWMEEWYDGHVCMLFSGSYSHHWLSYNSRAPTSTICNEIVERGPRRCPYFCCLFFFHIRKLNGAI